MGHGTVVPLHLRLQLPVLPHRLLSIFRLVERCGPAVYIEAEALDRMWRW